MSDPYPYPAFGQNLQSRKQHGRYILFRRAVSSGVSKRATLDTMHEDTEGYAEP
jgi:hypothetical protein